MFYVIKSSHKLTVENVKQSKLLINYLMYLIDIVVLRCSTSRRRRERVTAKGGGDGKIKNLIVIIDFYFRINYSVNLIDGKMLRGRKQYSQDRMNIHRVSIGTNVL